MFTVSITLEFDEQPTKKDIYDYLKELLQDESLRCDVEEIGGEYHKEYY